MPEHNSLWRRFLSCSWVSWFRAEWQILLTVLLGALLALLSNWAAAETKDALDSAFGVKVDPIHWLRVLAYSLAFVVLALIVFFVGRKAWTNPRTRLFRKKVAPRREHLVLFLSDLRNLDADAKQNCGIPKGLQLTQKNLAADLKQLHEKKESQPAIRWSWEMPLRALAHHQTELKSVILVCSTESLKQAPWMKQLLLGYKPSLNVRLLKTDGKKITLVDAADGATAAATSGGSTAKTQGGWDFEDFDSLSEGLIWLFAKLNQEGIPDHEIMVDITGGQKPSSVVGAAVTFNRKIEAQYVQTNADGNGVYNVFAYDLVLTHYESPTT